VAAEVGAAGEAGACSFIARPYANSIAPTSPRRRRIGEDIADGYRRVPQDDDEVRAATRAAIRSIHEKPW
jgi:hypothetical protein